MMARMRKWKGWKAVCKTVCFLLLLALVLGRVNGVLALKNDHGICNMEKFYEQEDGSVDLLVLGSSHSFVNIDPGTLWDEYGIPTYDLGGSIQPMWNTFYYLKEALKTQRPRLIVMDAYTTAFVEEYNDNERAISNTFGMKWSRDKVEAIRVSTSPDVLNSFLLGYTQYHARTKELSRGDFLEDMGDPAQYTCWKGSHLSAAVSPQEWPVDIQTEERVAMTEKTEIWYRKTIELAQSSGIPFLIVVIPYPGVMAAQQSVMATQQAVYNTAADVAAEYGVPFVNFNLDFESLGLDASSDYFDGHHMNIWGAKKFSRFLGVYLTDHYDLPDRRGDPAYQSWEDNAQYIRDYARNADLARTATPENAASLLQDPDYTCAVSVSGNGAATYAPLLEALGIPTVEPGMWLTSSGEILWASGTEGEVYFELDYHDLKLTASPSGNEMVFDREALQTVPDGVSLLVYDAATQSRAAYFTFDAVTSG